MSDQSVWLLVVAMALVTFATRFSLFALPGVQFSPRWQRALGYVPVSVFAAIIVPMVLAPQGGAVQLSLSNPYLLGALAAGVLAVRTGNLLLTLMAGFAVFGSMKWWLS
ncbi:AzlD domain-containing protein [Atopomonas sediminilitoris]|uniref:AzlD domain-containing protein n=1 Tax=Atopomonas sediminilitoris TaxID=2919919 RepID=UPI001F4ED75D|nr:AzlD domain-containing protein [Atopomonas sediminilitoris]MCJ8170139.1 AzlD domain-containing protein [Atopomonas sediminilitoris]